MQNAPYTFYYIQRHQIKSLLKQYASITDQQDIAQFITEIGEYLYQFKIQDKYSFWTVLKTAREIHTLFSYIQESGSNKRASYYQVTLKTKLNINQFQNSPFELNQIYIPEQSQSKKGHSYRQIPRYLIKFFEIYNTNIRKITSLRMHKKVRGLTRAKRVQNWCCGAQFQPKRIIVTQQGVLQMANNGSVTDFLKFDLYFSIQSGMQNTGYEFGISLFSAQRKVVLTAFNMKDFLTFLFYTTRICQSLKKGIHYGGSCRPSSSNYINFLIDAQNYYREVAMALQQAKTTIFLCGWWISPQLYLIRPIQQNQAPNKSYRLDNILKRVAQRGIKIYIVVFLSPSLIPNDSDYTKRALANLHPNITVQRHPHQFLPKLWSHHEKVVVIDQKIAFLGGIDLCYGRYDSNSHPVSKNDVKMYPGIDYNNIRIKDFIEVSHFDKDLQSRNLPRLPWHDIHFKVAGKMVVDVANHFIQYWNFTLLEKRMTPIVSKAAKQDFEETRQNLQKSKIMKQQKQQNSNNLVFGIMKLAVKQDQNLTQKQRMQMYDFIQNKSKRQKLWRKLRRQRKGHKFQLNNGPGQCCLVLSIEGLGLLKIDTKGNQKNKKNFRDQVQLLRSASQWSIGLENGVTERSIQNAYLKLIHDAKHYIYIQNQFFISATGDPNNSFVSNQIANALYQRIERAIKKQQKFKVVVFMPLIPGMQGELTQKCPLSLKLTMFWQFNTISQCKDALIPRVKLLTQNPQNYIQFYSLRGHGILNQIPVTQLIYIHSKLMIVDDNYVICGSANINDRSQQGNRDSQLAVLFTNGQKTTKMMDGQLKEVNYKAHNLRSKLYREHFGMSQVQAQDPLCLETNNQIKKRAKANTEAFRNIFGCCPDDNVKKLSQVHDFQKIPNLQTYMELSKQIKGHAVQFPTMFLSEQKMFTLNIDMVQDIFT